VASSSSIGGIGGGAKALDDDSNAEGIGSSCGGKPFWCPNPAKKEEDAEGILTLCDPVPLASIDLADETGVFPMGTFFFFFAVAWDEGAQVATLLELIFPATPLTGIFFGLRGSATYREVFAAFLEL
jgi:hypothetical protein